MAAAVIAVVAAAFQVSLAGASRVAPFLGTWLDDNTTTKEQTRAVIGVDGTNFEVSGDDVRRAPATLVNVVGSINAFAQDGGELAWTSGGPPCPHVRIRGVRGGATEALSGTFGGDDCYVLDAFALGGSRILWGGFQDCCNHGYGTVATAAPRSKRKELHGIGQEYHSWGDFLTGAAGDGETLVYSLTTIDLSRGKEIDGNWGFVHCLPRDPCTWDVTGGGVWRVIGTKAVRVPGTPPTALVAAARRRIALAPADRRRFPGPCSNERPVGCPEIRTAAGGRVEIRDAITGIRTASFSPRGRVTALALDAQTVAVIARSGRTARVEWYSTRSGRQLGARRVPRELADVLSVAGHTVVLQSGRTILALDLATKLIRDLARARSEPIGLSIEGTRVAWAETAGGRSFVRAVSVH
jgi:hypothetical protein